MTAIEAAAHAAAATPSTARSATRVHRSGATALSRDANAKTAMPDRKTRRAPWRSLIAPAESSSEVRDERQVLRLGALETLAGTYVPAVLKRFAERRPDIDVEIRSESARDGLLADLVDGRIEAALLLDSGEDVGHLGFPAPAEPLSFVDLDPVPLALVAAPAHPLSARTGLTPADLEHERLLVNVPECSFWMAGNKILGLGPERVKAGGVPVMRAWAEHGLGISLLPEFAVAESLGAGTLVRLDLPVPDLSLRLVWREDHEALPGMRDMLYAAARP
jgi:DNA-binding transcriptional LysR family regulator